MKDWYTFESFVNSERCKTIKNTIVYMIPFESFVNSERCKTSLQAPQELI